MTAPARRFTGWLAALAALIAACYVGPSASSIPAVLTGEGAACDVRLKDSDLMRSGELLAANDSAAIMVVGRRVWVVSYRLVQESYCRDIGSLPFDSNGVLVPSLSAPFRLRARYPQGVDGALLGRLAAAYGHPALIAPAQP